MSKKNIVLLSFLIVLGAIYVINFTSLFREPRIEILSREHPQVNARRAKNASPQPAGNSLSFLLNRNYQLTSVKVVAESDARTNKYPRALWHLISDSNSIPTKALYYGVPVPGMRPKFANTRPESLENNIPYILMIEAGKLKGQTGFTVH